MNIDRIIISLAVVVPGLLEYHALSTGLTAVLRQKTEKFEFLLGQIQQISVDICLPVIGPDLKLLDPYSSFVLTAGTTRGP